MGYILKLSPDETKIRIFTEGGMECIGYITEDSVHFNRTCSIDKKSYCRILGVMNYYDKYRAEIHHHGRLSI